MKGGSIVGLVLASVLTGMGPGRCDAAADTAALVTQLKARYLSEREAAVNGLLQLDAASRKPLVPELVKLIEEGNWLSLVGATRVLSEMGADAAAAAPGMVQTVKKLLAQQRRAPVSLLIRTLSKIDPKSPEVLVPDVVALLDDNDKRAALWACELLDQVGPASKGALPSLLRLLSGEDAELAARAARTLGSLGAEARPALDPLIQALESKHPTVPPEAAAALGALGPQAAPAVPALTKALRHKDGDLAAKAAGSLQAIGPAAAPALPALVANLKRPEPNAKTAAENAIAAVGDAAVQPLAEMVKTRDAAGALTAAQILGKIGPAAKPAAAELTAALTGDDRRLANAAAAALFRIDKASLKTVAEAFERSLKEGNDEVAPAAARSLVALATDAGADATMMAGVVQALIEALQGKSTAVKQTAVECLGNLGPAAKAALPAVTEAALGAEVKDAAQAAFKKIAPDQPLPTRPKMTAPETADDLKLE